MKVSRVSESYFTTTEIVQQIKGSLEKLAKVHHTTVPELLESAKSAGCQALPYQVRALNLQARLDKLSD